MRRSGPTFWRSADALARHSKGDLLALSGRVTQSSWTGNDGEERTNLATIADQLVSACTVRPAAGQSANSKLATDHKPGPMEYAATGGAADDFDDDVPFYMTIELLEHAFAVALSGD